MRISGRISDGVGGRFSKQNLGEIGGTLVFLRNCEGRNPCMTSGKKKSREDS